MAEFVSNQDLIFDQGSLILVTGVSGMIAVHIAHEALKAGFRVRGTVRSAEKGQVVAKLLQSPNFEFVIVEDMATDNAFHKAMEGVSAAIHTASSREFPSRLEDVRTPLMKGSMNILEAALASTTVKRVVFTSILATAGNPLPGIKFHIDHNTWNTEAFDMVRTLSVQRLAELGFDWKMYVYRVAKLEVERAVWEFVKEKKPPFSVNVVSPGLNFGNTMGSVGLGGTQIFGLLDGNIPLIPSLYMVDLVDNSRIHISAAIDITVSNERIFACDEPFTWLRVAQILQKLLPDAELPLIDPDEPSDLKIIENRLGADLLTKWWRQPGYKGLEQTIRETLNMCLEKRPGQYKRRERAIG